MSIHLVSTLKLDFDFLIESLMSDNGISKFPAGCFSLFFFLWWYSVNALKIVNVESGDYVAILDPYISLFLAILWDLQQININNKRILEI